tara:strand:+ start:2258 stop:2425 length:168 start_codon:yes stop_codon:yes gene_type:complete
MNYLSLKRRDVLSVLTFAQKLAFLAKLSCVEFGYTFVKIPQLYLTNIYLKEIVLD